ncbi:hypothetical protein NS277_15895 [Novosphingobium barchaimii]|nr:hypothetical protein NS277_15895 [Novosphingobium barchaimii]
MLTSEQMTAAVHSYARLFSAQDRAGWLALFVDRPIIIEPADAPLRGREALERAFDDIKAAGVHIALQPLRVIANGHDAAMHMKVRATLPDGSVHESSVIEIFTFADDGRIEVMRAFLDPVQLPN